MDGDLGASDTMAVDYTCVPSRWLGLLLLLQLQLLLLLLAKLLLMIDELHPVLARPLL